jgi:co-chaperonin GroES (HSP10)
MKPIGKYIAIKAIEEEIKTKSGLLLSGEDTSQLRYKKGIVVEPGTDVTSIKKGDVLYYDKGHSYTMHINDEQITVIRESDVVIVE